MGWLFNEPNPIALNTVMGMTGGANPVFRAPYWPYSKEKRMDGVEALSSFDVSEIYGGRPYSMNDGDFKILSEWADGVSYVDKQSKSWPI